MSRREFAALWAGVLAITACIAVLFAVSESLFGKSVGGAVAFVTMIAAGMLVSWRFLSS